jgi:hypothetical protein
LLVFDFDRPSLFGHFKATLLQPFNIFIWLLKENVSPFDCLPFFTMTNTIFESFTSDIGALTDARNSFIIGFGLFLVTLLIIRSQQSLFDEIVAKKITAIIRILSILEIFWMAPLLYSAMDLGSPIVLSTLPYNIGVSWIYGLGRPSLGIFLIIFGLIAGIHPLPRLLCIIGSAQALIFDSISAFQINDYQNQMRNNLAPVPSNYSTAMLSDYYFRDISSIVICTYLLMTTSFASVILGCCGPQTVPYVRVDGESFDRCQIMKQQSTLRSCTDNSDARKKKNAEKSTGRKRRKEFTARQCERARGGEVYTRADELQELRLTSSDPGTDRVSSLTVETQNRREICMV